MIVRASKYCNGCADRVAEKRIFWHTIKDYVTIRGDDVPSYADQECPTTYYNLHYCRSCWNKFIGKLEVNYE